MRVLIYGGGAVGLGIASCLIKSGIMTSVLVHDQSRLILCREGLFRHGIFGECFFEGEKFQSISGLKDAANNLTGIFDFIIVAVKSFDSAAAALDIKEHPGILSGNGRIILFQNGWGNAEEFLKYFEKNLIYNARVITGFSRPSKNHVNITVHAEPVHIGCLYDDTDFELLSPLCKAIAGGGIPCEAVSDIGSDIWAKMLYNCALNPLGAVFKVNYGRLAESPYSMQIMKSLIKEIYMVMKAAGFRTHWNTPEEYLDVFYSKLIPPTAGHQSSMLQSILAGQKTEIDAMNGAIVRLARDHNIDTPANDLIYKIIKFEEGI
ncbi:MAG: ketopantoate reductase family protein [Brevinematales bacterium]|jgi:2-dehydropantoate 2-reductase